MCNTLVAVITSHAAILLEDSESQNPWITPRFFFSHSFARFSGGSTQECKILLFLNCSNKHPSFAAISQTSGLGVQEYLYGFCHLTA